ncbi:MAG TPA: cation:proton antiporter [Candidatus Omnitrophica bacterium]|nr:cation:proton antiporter [Candidatus Omnitrophota bacterium]
MNTRDEKGMTEIVKKISKISSLLMFIFGIYVIVYGHITPGGGFAGGVIMACSLFVLVIANGKGYLAGVFKKGLFSKLDALGASLFAGIAFLGFLGGSFFLNILPKGKPWDVFSAGMIPLCNMSIGLKIFASLFAGFIAITAAKIVKNEKKDGMIYSNEESC